MIVLYSNHMDLEAQWQQFISGNDDELFTKEVSQETKREAPLCAPLKISTKSKII